MLLKNLIQRGLLVFIFCQLLLSANAQQIITLESALEIARNNSPDIRRSLLNLKNSEESLKAQNAALKSNFSLNVTPLSYDKTRSFDTFQSVWNTSETTQSFGTFTISQPFLPTDGTISLNNRFGWQNSYSENGRNLAPKTFSNNLYLSIAQPLFTYNRTKLSLKTLELNLENAQLNYSMQKLNLEMQVTQLFYNVYLAQMSLNIAQDEFTNTQKSYEITQNKVTAGISAKEELYQAELNFATAKSTLENAQVTLDNNKDQFKQYIGMDIMEEMTVMTDVAFNPVNVDVKKAIEYGLNSRMELRQREIDVTNAQFQLIRTNSLNEFRGDLNLSIGIIGVNETLPDIYKNPTNNPRVSVSFNVPLWDWGEKKARIKAQEAVIETQEINQSEQKKQITVDIRKVYRSLQNQTNQIEIAAQNEKNAQLTYEINLERYANGDLTSMDMNLFQTQLSQKKMSYAQALINYKVELLNLKIQSLYDFEKNEAIVPEYLIQKKK
ncbi:MAG: TolC family protein [Prolixibacteraceae bacterium]|nr:TolC family protein [Prolixibacteraceae bacterium]